MCAEIESSGRSVIPGGLREMASPLPTYIRAESKQLQDAAAVQLRVLGAMKVGKTRLSGRCSLSPAQSGLQDGSAPK